jgi:hypothetical protein
MTFGPKLVVLHKKPSMFHNLQCMLGGSAEVQTKTICSWFIEGQTHFGMPRGAKLSSALNEQK